MDLCVSHTLASVCPYFHRIKKDEGHGEAGVTIKTMMIKKTNERLKYTQDVSFGHILSLHFLVVVYYQTIMTDIK
jgi:hypothetical protein